VVGDKEVLVNTFSLVTASSKYNNTKQLQLSDEIEKEKGDENKNEHRISHQFIWNAS
jgi:hypothetical protein